MAKKAKHLFSEDNWTLAGLDTPTYNVIKGTSGSDLLIGTSGADQILGRGGADLIFGGGGNDLLSGGKSIDLIDGGAGRDTVDYSKADGGVNVNLALGIALSDGDGAADVLASVENVLGSDHADTIAGNSQANELDGGAGNDELAGGKGADTYYHSGTSADGDDTIKAGDNGVDRVIFTTADLYDLRYERHGNDLVIGGYLAGSSFEDGPFDGSLRIVDHYAGAAIDTVSMDTGSYNGLYGTDPETAHFHFTTDLANGLNNEEDTEVLLGSDAGETINANGGYYDLIFANGGDDLVNGGAGIDNIRGGTGNDTISGGDEVDILRGQDGDDTLSGDAGNDFIRAGNGNDVLLGGDDHDQLEGDDGNDFLFGGAGSDGLVGGAGSDTFQVSMINHPVDNGDGSFSNDSPNIFDFNRDEDILRFSDVLDVNSDGLALDDLIAQISTFEFDEGTGTAFIMFNSGTSLFIHNQTGPIASITDLVADPTTQIQVV
jgi:Ca2+-binding RTX toxin-like protein